MPRDFSLRGPMALTFVRGARGNVVIFAPGSNPFGSLSLVSQDGLTIFCKSRQAAAVKINQGGLRPTFYFGADGSSNGLNAYLEAVERSILLGEDAMVSHDVAVMCSDFHAVVQRSTLQPVNPPADVVIEPHVWLGRESVLMKGVTVGFGAIVGVRALVTKSVEPFSAVGGSPAKVVRSDTTWFRSTAPKQGEIDEFMKREAEFLAKPA